MAARACPTGRGAINEKGLAFYDRLVDGLLERGIQPYATLYHWDLPQALEDDGGWRNRDTAYRFADYAAITQFRLGDRVRHWATLNEPWCSAFLGHASGEHAPGPHRPGRGRRSPRTTCCSATASRRRRCTAAAARPRSASCSTSTTSTPASDAPADVDAARRLDGQQNRWYLDPVLHGLLPRGRRRRPRALHRHVLRAGRRPRDHLHPPRLARHQLLQLVRGARPRRPGRARARRAADPVDRHRGHRDRRPTGLPQDPHGLGRRPRGPHQHPGARRAATTTPPPIFITENGSAYEDEVVDGEVHDADAHRRTSTRTCARASTRSTAASTCAATSPGRCSTTSSGPGATRGASASCASTTTPSSAPRRTAPSATPPSRAEQRLADCPRRDASARSGSTASLGGARGRRGASAGSPRAGLGRAADLHEQELGHAAPDARSMSCATVVSGGLDVRGGVDCRRSRPRRRRRAPLRPASRSTRIAPTAMRSLAANTRVEVGHPLEQRSHRGSPGLGAEVARLDERVVDVEPGRRSRASRQPARRSLPGDHVVAAR